MWLALGEYRGPLNARAFVRYALARSEHENDERSFRVYVTDCLAAWVGATTRWADAITPLQDFDADEVISDIASRAGLEVIG